MTDVETFDDRTCELGEGPFYDDETATVGWVDILGKRVLSRDPVTGDTGEIGCPAHVGAAVPRSGGGLVLCLPAGPVLRDADGSLHPLGGYADADRAARIEPSLTPVRSNDAKPDPAGRLWLGTNAYDGTPEVCALYRLDSGAPTIERVLGGVSNSNGLGWTADGSLMFYIDSATQRIDVFDFDAATGALDGRRPFAAIAEDAGAPDGMCVDTDGGVWVALWGGGTVHRYGPDGVLDRVVELPTPLVTSCAFVGPDRQQLIITTAVDDRGPHGGLTYRHVPGDVAGVPVPPYAG